MFLITVRYSDTRTALFVQTNRSLPNALASTPISGVSPEILSPLCPMPTSWPSQRRSAWLRSTFPGQ